MPTFFDRARVRASLPTFRDLAADLPASFVVFLVAVPLSMGIALASGAPIVSGLVAAAVGGILVGLFGGAPLQVSGPAAGLAVLVYGYVQELGWPSVCAVVVAAGLLQIGLGSARVARAALAISPAVIYGMLAGIGLQIALAQLHVLLGGGPQSSAIANIRELPRQVLTLHGPASFLGVLTIAILLAWPLLPIKPLRVIPASLVGVAVSTTLGVVLAWDVPRVTLPSNIFSALATPKVPLDKLGPFALAAVTTAFVASAESLLCAIATDKLHGGPRARLDRELLAQGLGNVASGMLGGLPVTGVIVRSTANIGAGAKTRASATLHGVWVVVALTVAGPLLNKIPLAALAALLVVVGVKLLDPRQIRPLRAHRELSTFVVTFAGVVGLNLLAGIALGFAWAVVLLLRRRTRISVRVEREDGRYHVIVRGALTFVGVPALLEELSKLAPAHRVDIDLDVEMIDHAGFEALHGWRTGYEKLGGSVDFDQSHPAGQRPGASAA
jgi:carbonic anhydrase